MLHKKPPFRHLENKKMIFLCDEKENFLLQHCSPSQDAHVCTIWAHYHKLCRDSSHNIGRLDWKPWNLEHDSSFLRRFFWDICNIPSLIFFLATMSHNMTPREGFTLFGSFLNFLYPFQTMVKTAGMKILSSGLSLAKLAVENKGCDHFTTRFTPVAP